MNATTTNSSPSNKRSLSSTSTVLRKRRKKEPAVDRNGAQKSPKEKIIMDLITSTSPSKNEDSAEDTVPTKKKLVWDDGW